MIESPGGPVHDPADPAELEPTHDPPPELVEPTPATAELVDEPSRDPPPELIDALVRHYTAKRADLQRQIADMESFLGFLEVSGGLAERVAKLEKFLGLKG